MPILEEANRVRRVNSITFNLDLENGENQEIVYKFRGGTAPESNVSIAFDRNNNEVTISFNYCAFEFERIKIRASDELRQSTRPSREYFD